MNNKMSTIRTKKPSHHLQQSHVFILFLFLCLFLMLTCAPSLFALSDFGQVNKKHALIVQENNGKDHLWKMLGAFLTEEDPFDDDNRMKLLFLVALEPMSESNIKMLGELSNNSTAGKILEENAPVFDQLQKMLTTYERIVRDMDLVYTKASKIYMLELPDEEVMELKSEILMKAKWSYRRLRKNALQIYRQGIILENLLLPVYKTILKVFSLQKLESSVARGLAERLKEKKTAFNQEQVNLAIEKIKKELSEIRAESKRIYLDAMKNLNLNSQGV